MKKFPETPKQWGLAVETGEGESVRYDSGVPTARQRPWGGREYRVPKSSTPRGEGPRGEREELRVETRRS